MILMIRYSQIIFTQKTEESQIFYTLTQGAKNCKFLVKRELKAIDSQSSIIFKVSFIIYTTRIQLFSSIIQCRRNQSRSP